MPQSHFELVNLVVQAPDEATEIFLVDAGLERIASAVGTLQARVAPGLYKIRYRSGSTQNDTLIQVQQDDGDLFIRSTPVQFRTAVPISDTGTNHAHQSTPASAHSRQSHISIGKGSYVFLFVREAELKSWNGCHVALYDLAGTRLAGLETGFTDTSARFSTVNIELVPGTYAVRVEHKVLGSYEMYVTASPGWQTQVFLSFEDIWYQGSCSRVPSIRRASLLMARPNVGFDPDLSSSRTSELAKQALAQGRDIVSPQLLTRLLQEKFDDPILGLMVAHLLLRRPHRDMALLQVVCRNVRMMLGDHPDVQALELSIDRAARDRIKEIVAPPSLRSSWELITKVTHRRASLVPPEGIVAQIAQYVVRAGPWLTRRVPEGTQKAPAVATIAGAIRLTEKLIAQNPDALMSIAQGARLEGRPLSGIEQVVLSSSISLAMSRSRHKPSTTSGVASPKGDPRALLNNISAPSYAVANAVVSLAERLNIKA